MVVIKSIGSWWSRSTSDSQKRRRVAVLGGSTSFVALSLAVGLVALNRNEAPVLKPAPSTTTTVPITTTTSTTAPTTTAPPTTVPPGPKPRLKNARLTIASVKSDSIIATPTVPADAVAQPRTEFDPGAPPPRGSESANASPLPNPDYPIVGRRSFGEGWIFDNPGPFGENLTFLVTAKQGHYLEVELPVRPNGTRAWIDADAVTLSNSSMHVEVILAEHRLLAWDGDRLLADVQVAVGTPDTRTPLGRHFITDRVEQHGGSMYGPWIFGLNAYSEDMNTFDGGAPQIALHGWNNESAFGRSVSNGCIRVPNDVIDRLSSMPLGTIVDVWAT